MVWRKSTKSGPWTDACVEVDFVKSTHSDAYSNCVEVGEANAVAYVRDSKDPEGLVLRFNREEWIAFIAGVKDGEFDLE
jgi:uncharacterized protein DUF397